MEEIMFAHSLGNGAEVRLLERGHAGELFTLCDQNRDRLHPWLPWIDQTHSAGDVERFIESALAQFAAGLGFHAGLFHDGAMAGCIGMHPIDRQHKNVSLGYWVGSAFEGRGLITRAVAAVTTHCFDDLGLHRVEIRCAVENVRSRAVAERLGFQREGVLRGAQFAGGRWLDLYLFGKLATD
jgi:ribosomal-protein-serine acetyltransferase